MCSRSITRELSYVQQQNKLQYKVNTWKVGMSASCKKFDHVIVTSTSPNNSPFHQLTSPAACLSASTLQAVASLKPLLPAVMLPSTAALTLDLSSATWEMNRDDL